MDFSTKVDTVKSGWSIVYIERSQVIFSTNKNIFLSLMTNFVLANNAVPDELQHNCGISSGSSLFANVPV